jgi:predicted outer membrane protein
MLPVAAQAQVGQTQPGTIQQPQQPQKPQKSATTQNAAATSQNAAATTRQAQNRGGSQQTDQQLEQLFATKLMIANKGVLELSKMATEKASDAKVKEFAQTLVKEHENLCRTIEKLQTSKGYASKGENSTDNRPGQTAQKRPGQPGRPTGTTEQAGNVDSDSQGLVGKLEMIAEKSSKNQLEMAKEMLQKHEGSDFDMAFVGLQIASHIQAVAELNALQGVGSKEMQEVVKQAETATSQHLKNAKDLADQLSSK